MRTILLSCLALALLLAAAWALPASAQVRLSEIMADPASDWDHDGSYNYKSDEWIEVTNAGTAPVNLQDYWVRDEVASGPRMRLSGVIDPGETAVFYGSDAVSWQQAQGISTAGFSLNNGGDTVYLLQGPDGGPYTTLESVTFPDHTADDDRSYGLDQDGLQWMLYDGLFPYGGEVVPQGSGCEPTPAEPNFCHTQVATEVRSMGVIKATFY